MRSVRESETDRGGGNRRDLYLFNLEGSEMQEVQQCSLSVGLHLTHNGNKLCDLKRKMM